MVDCTGAHCLKTPAKLNLGLRIVGRRADGYHLLESLFWPITLVDELSFESSDGPSVTMEWSDDTPLARGEFPPEKDNIVYRALKGAPWKVRVRKRIPMGAGLGGGSSNAAAVIRFLGRPPQEASTLGADVPYFLDPRPAWVTGIGERRHNFDVSPEARALQFLLVLPPFSCPTPQIFAHYKAAGTSFSPSSTTPSISTLTLENMKNRLALAGNDLEGPATEAFPLIGDIIRRLRARGPLYAGLSGSGSTCFAVFEGSDARKETLKALDAFFRSANCKSVEVETYTAA